MNNEYKFNIGDIVKISSCKCNTEFNKKIGVVIKILDNLVKYNYIISFTKSSISNHDKLCDFISNNKIYSFYKKELVKANNKEKFIFNLYD